MSKIEIRKKFTGEWALNVSSQPEGDFPAEVFLHTVDSDGSLGEFQSVANADELHYPVYTPRDSNFGIRLVRSSTASKTYPSEVEIDKAIVVIKSTFNRLLTDFGALSTEVVEIYP